MAGVAERYTLRTQNALSSGRVGSIPTTGTTKMYYTKPIIWNREVLAYLIGVGLGDGSLSNPNGRVVCFRIFCDSKYQKLLNKITVALNSILPESKVYLVKTKSKCVVLVSYSKYWENILGWKVGQGSKFEQNVQIPEWIWCQDRYVKACLQGLVETDGSIYYDRGYPMVMFTNIVPGLAYGVKDMM